MKKIFALLIAMMMLFSLAACGEKAEKPSDGEESKITESAPDSIGGESIVAGEENGDAGSKKACAFCFDLNGGDRKCDDCGNWVYPDGEVRTQDVPTNLRV
ncbi:MAG: hypothetical protein IJN86_07100, partial [Clostridia bacterium]|nr:hypothetical protein [Clostridia bacterium]